MAYFVRDLPFYSWEVSLVSFVWDLGDLSVEFLRLSPFVLIVRLIRVRTQVFNANFIIILN